MTLPARDNMSLTAQHSFVANGGDLLSSYQPPLLNPATSVSYGYTLDELLSYTSVQGMSNGPSYTYDAGGRLSTVSYAHPVGGTVTVTNTYDKLGNQNAAGHLLQNSATNGGYGRTAALNYSYDGAMKTSEQYAGPINGGANTGIWPNNSTHSVDYTYDSRMRVATRRVDLVLGVNGTSAVTATTFSYDNDSLVNMVSLNETSPAVDYTVCRGTLNGNTCNTTGSNGLVVSTKFGAITDTYTYNVFGEVTNYTALRNEMPLYKADYGGRDGLGRMSRRHEEHLGTLCNWDYQFDPGNTNTNSFLTSAIASGPCGYGSATWPYDHRGNINSTWWSYDEQDRLTNSGWAYTLDAWGNHTQRQSGGANIGFGDDALGNMRQYTCNLAGTNTQYIVDGKNRRVAKYEGNNGAFLGEYLYEGDRVIATVNSANNVDAYFVYVTKPNVPDIMARWDNISWKWVAYRIISDQIGSVRLIVDSSGTVIEGPFFYETWGTTATWPTVVPFGWAGGLWDGSGGNGLYHFGARDYHPWVARW